MASRESPDSDRLKMAIKAVLKDWLAGFTGVVVSRTVNAPLTRVVTLLQTQDANPRCVRIVGHAARPEIWELDKRNARRCYVVLV